MDKPKTTPKDFFLWAGAMLTLYGGVVAFIALIFNYINYAFPDPLRYWGDPYQGGISYQMASLIVLTPVFLLLMRFIRRSIKNDSTRREIWVRRWALFLTVFLAGVTIVVDLIVLLTTFLQGEELTIAFLLKIAVVLLVASAGFMHFLADLWGYWEQYPERARWINYGVGLLVILTILAGFFIVGTPAQARLMRFDTQKVNDLQSLQSQIVSYYQQKQTLPTTLANLNDPLSYFSVPMDPQTGENYEYQKTGDRSFTLCAQFNAEDSSNRGMGSRAIMPTMYGVNDNWKHSAGRQCFERTIDPELYPPFTKPVAF
ncbi:hypothetical protein H7X87_00865 [Acetobacteraceae bacterium]|nr:hypothetical protein [Candidatus Parcubacteria bacterium]